MADHHAIAMADGRQTRVVFTGTADGDFRVIDPSPGLPERRAGLIDRPWSWLRQVHGAVVRQVGAPGQHAGADGDGLYTVVSGCPIAVTTADCAPVVLVAERGVAVVHAGWRGLVAGIVERAGRELHEAAGGPVAALLGPCISPEVYQFGLDDLEQVIERYGPSVAARTSDGDPALDVPAGVAEACRRAGWPAPERPACTSDPRWYSHRVRTDTARQTVVAWIEEPDDGV